MRAFVQEMTALAEGKPRERRLVELNVVESCLNLFKTPTVQKKRVGTYMNPDYAFTTPRIHALVFDPSVNASSPLSGSARPSRQRTAATSSKMPRVFLERHPRSPLAHFLCLPQNSRGVLPQACRSVAFPASPTRSASWRGCT